MYQDDQHGWLCLLQAFNEAARNLRGVGVFSEEYFDWLAQLISVADGEEKAALQRVMARLSNPLLRQAAPYE